MKQGKTESLESMKACLLNIGVKLEYFQNHFQSLNSFSDFKNYLRDEEKRIVDLINQDAEPEKVIHELESLLEKVQNFYKLATNQDLKDETNSVSLQTTFAGEDVLVDSLDFSKVDALYEQLYNAVSTNNMKKETLYRGRIIRALVLNEDLIQEKYDKVKVLEEIQKMIENKSPTLLQDVRKVLLEPQNKKYYEFFADSFQSETSFVEKYNTLCQRPEIQKIFFYHAAINEELKQQGKKLDERYSKEFLDKKAGLSSVDTTLPTAVGLSVQKLSNTIREAKEAKTNRRKVAKTLESVKEAGVVLATPVIYLGKFVINNWYALYSVYRGYQNAKVMEEERVAAEEQAMKEAKADEAKARAGAEKKVTDEARAKAAEDAQREAAETRKAMEEAKKAEEARARAEEAAKAAEKAAKAAEEARAREAVKPAIKTGLEVKPESAPETSAQTSPEPAEQSSLKPIAEPKPAAAPQTEAPPNPESVAPEDVSVDSDPSDFVIRIPVVPMVANPKVNAMHDPDGTPDGIYWNEIRPKEIIKDIKDFFGPDSSKGGSGGRGGYDVPSEYHGHGGKF